jgi:glutamate N-acetyltransferase/amino-acid N-acetyltransferase
MATNSKRHTKAMAEDARQLFPDQPLWLVEGTTTDWEQHEIWVDVDGTRVDIRPVSEIVVDGVTAASRSIPTSMGGVDLSMVSARGATAAGLFTMSACASPCVVRGREAIADGRLDVLAIVSKNANVATPTAEADTEALVGAIADRFAVAPRNVLLSCTGVIGQRLAVEDVVSVVPATQRALAARGLGAVSHGILTTDRRPKMVAANVGGVTVAGMVKGAGMIEPRMATMLAYVFTDAAVESALLRSCFHDAAGQTLNALTIDSDTSTSDTAVIIATGARELPESDVKLFRHAVLGVCAALARAVVFDAEGATKLLEVNVTGAATVDACAIMARQIANSPLVKAAANGNDPNWGRVVMALGKPGAFGHHMVDMSALRIALMGITTYDRGRQVEYERGTVATYMRDSPTVTIDVDLGVTSHRATIWGSDLSEEYVRFNSVYTT